MFEEFEELNANCWFIRDIANQLVGFLSIFFDDLQLTTKTRMIIIKRQKMQLIGE